MALLNAKVQELERQYKEANDEKEAAIRESARCQRKLELANRLINALASEGERWALTVESLRKNYEVLTGERTRAAAGGGEWVWREALACAAWLGRLAEPRACGPCVRPLPACAGDMLLAAAFVSYAGPFTAKFRAQLIEDWILFLRERHMPMTEGVTDPLKVGPAAAQPHARPLGLVAHLCSLARSFNASVLRCLRCSYWPQVLVDDAMVASWLREGLPSDPTSVQNGTILTNSERWSLMMDPQLQGILWIKERESKNNLQVPPPSKRLQPLPHWPRSCHPGHGVADALTSPPS